jgi:polyhydroxyalkanoate synthesis regulator phasin
MKMAPLLEKMEKLEKEAEVLKGDMSPQEIKAFMESYTKLINRFREASLKINNNNN